MDRPREIIGISPELSHKVTYITDIGDAYHRQPALGKSRFVSFYGTRIVI